MRQLKYAFFLLIISHLLLMGLYPLMDTTEARYADIARRMLELNDWITPWFNDHQPFWGKPPMSFWVTMFGFKLFGVNEFGARFFYWVTSILVLLMTYATAKTHSKRLALFTLPVLASFVLFYVSSVAVMTDMVLVLGGVIAMYSQYNVTQGLGNKTANSIILSIGLSIGLLAKGPIALILFLSPLFSWLVFSRQIKTLLKGYNLLWIIAMTGLLSIPWYFLAEQKTPGFLHYFIVGEHWQRFLVPGWKGDLYGTAHDFARGSIWGFFIVSTLPLCLVLPYIVYKNGKAFMTNQLQSDLPSKSLLYGWVITPLLFFTVSGNVLWTYVLPGLPAFAIILSDIMIHSFRKKVLIRLIMLAMMTSLVIKLSYVYASNFSSEANHKSTKFLIQAFKNKHIALDHVYFYEEVPFSAKFYSNGKTKRFDQSTDCQNHTKEVAYLVMKKKYVGSLSNIPSTLIHLKSTGRYSVYMCHD